ncbi:outer membrane beta-barrel protein [Paracoccus sp. CPCC 101403]|uniref:Outer membrane beta-barrel protein n=1 Tax=Paracoccus broussonetiae TaxID=3075834 RepID=A0ABU3EJH6_9RHOB|nr:outer membrane beta-barrel protein [Paracoccus sp. CPCC 101403]MDT1064398.1 outer membrane beta-barrel protein [Paracoccus sp. CPCC 101403]
MRRSDCPLSARPILRNFICTALGATAFLACLLPAAAADWSGCYGGVSLGVARAKSDITDKPFREGPFAGAGVGWNGAPHTVSADGTSAALGGTLGCDRQFQNGGDGAFILGAAMDLSALNAGGDVSFPGAGADTTVDFKVKNTASLRLRAGYAQDDKLFYVTGGYARGDIDAGARDHAPPAMMEVSGGGGRSGWVLGAGVEWRIAENRSLDFSLLHYDFGSVSATGAAEDPAGAFPRFENEVTADVLRVGMNWHF